MGPLRLAPPAREWCRKSPGYIRFCCIWYWHSLTLAFFSYQWPHGTNQAQSAQWECTDCSVCTAKRMLVAWKRPWPDIFSIPLFRDSHFLLVALLNSEYALLCHCMTPSIARCCLGVLCRRCAACPRFLPREEAWACRAAQAFIPGRRPIISSQRWLERYFC